ncbi:MAG: hypothetical protein COA99_05735 [Moraxellaceae bacterium]|nr:MAG: hypothetical protein COA99_05735 [Moraxellaceae bacterium]
MGIFAPDLKTAVIQPTLIKLNQCTPATEALLFGTACIMANLENQLSPAPDDPLFGLYSINKTTHRDTWDKHIAFNCDLASTIRGFASQRMFLENPEQELNTNLSYATAIAWAIYDAKLESFPKDPGDFLALATCWYDNYPHTGIAESQRKKSINTFIRAMKTNARSAKKKPPIAA